MIINIDTIIKDCDLNIDIRQKSTAVSMPLSQEDEDIIQSMYTYVKNSTDEELALKEKLKPAVGIAAIQIGIPKKMLVVICDDYDHNGQLMHYEYALINPRIVSSSIQQIALKSGEGCLSVEDPHPGYVYRSARIKIDAWDYLTKKQVQIKARNFLAIVLQHEMDHLNGILFYDHINKEDPFEIKKDAILLD
ncbi:peptide deformylase [Erysipelotrichaceae bacterium OH741_COT-311]|nr:peptide deformylase [Erysipelotrichaceae bacterium OH741_COT-311]